MRPTGGRHELKHYINYGDYLELKKRLPFVTMPDKHSGEGGSYRVKSLYFDNLNDKALKEKLYGIDNREKFRIRYYNNDTSFIRLEKKSKLTGLCFKKNAPISKEECESILNGIFPSLNEPMHPLKFELYHKILTEQLRPKNIIDYKRETFIYPPGNVRVTLDSDIRVSNQVKDFLNSDAINLPLRGIILLEIKYDSFLPEVIRGITALSSRQSHAFSKYAAARVI